MDKQKQIEEMAKDMLEYALTYFPKETKLKEQFYLAYFGYAQHLIKAGYRKIPENAVVLTREEWEKYQTTQRDWNAIYFDGIEKTRKETAEKFVSLLEERCKEKVGYEYSFGNIKNVIDKICKEIIEGER